MKYRVNIRVSTNYQVDVDCCFEHIAAAARKQCREEFGVDISDEIEIENIEKLEVEDGKTK